MLEKDNLAITESYFKDAISRVILFRELEKIVSDASWYDGGYRAQTVAYTISYLSYLIEKKGDYLNFNLIWERQKVPNKLREILKIVSENVYKAIINPPLGSANVAQWCKKKGCWDNIKSLNMGIVIDRDLLVNNEEQKYIKRETKKEKKLDNSIEIQMFVVGLEKADWHSLYDYYTRSDQKSNLSITQLDIVRKMALGNLRPPSEKQSKVLYLLYQQALKDGVVFSTPS